jgi:hypothetical protein
MKNLFCCAPTVPCLVHGRQKKKSKSQNGEMEINARNKKAISFFFVFAKELIPFLITFFAPFPQVRRIVAPLLTQFAARVRVLRVLEHWSQSAFSNCLA